MNSSDHPGPDGIQSWIDPDLEARIVAAVLGEASDFEKAELDRLQEEKPELAVFKRRIEAVHGLVGESLVEISAQDNSAWQMAPEKRARILQTLSGEPVSDSNIAPDSSDAPTTPAAKTTNRWRLWASVIPGAAAALLAVGFFLVNRVDSRRFATADALKSTAMIESEPPSPTFGFALNESLPESDVMLAQLEAKANGAGESLGYAESLQRLAEETSLGDTESLLPQTELPMIEASRGRRKFNIDGYVKTADEVVRGELALIPAQTQPAGPTATTSPTAPTAEPQRRFAGLAGDDGLGLPDEPALPALQVDDDVSAAMVAAAQLSDLEQQQSSDQWGFGTTTADDGVSEEKNFAKIDGSVLHQPRGSSNRTLDTQVAQNEKKADSSSYFFRSSGEPTVDFAELDSKSLESPRLVTRSGAEVEIEIENVREFVANESSIRFDFGIPMQVADNDSDGKFNFDVENSVASESKIAPDSFAIDLSIAPEVVEFEGFVNNDAQIERASGDEFLSDRLSIEINNALAANQPQSGKYQRGLDHSVSTETIEEERTKAEALWTIAPGIGTGGSKTDMEGEAGGGSAPRVLFGGGRTTDNSNIGPQSSANWAFTPPASSANPIPLGNDPLISGLRSGSDAISSDMIDGLIARQDATDSQEMIPTDTRGTSGNVSVSDEPSTILREKNTGTVNFGDGSSSIDNLADFFDTTETNSNFVSALDGDQKERSPYDPELTLDSDTGVGNAPDGPYVTNPEEQERLRERQEDTMELAKTKAGNGEYDEARGILNKKLAENPNDEQAQLLMSHLDDPDRYPAALTPEHIKNVREVERLLRLGVGYQELGQFNKAKDQFAAVLDVDQHNTAARGLMEKTDQSIESHVKTQRELASSSHLRQVDELWEVPEPSVALVPEDAEEDRINREAFRFQRDNTRRDMISQVELQTELDTESEIAERAAREQQGSPAVVGVSGVFTDPQLQTVLRALAEKKGIDMAASPSVIVRSGERASVPTVREFINPTEFDSPEIPQEAKGGGGAVEEGSDLAGAQTAMKEALEKLPAGAEAKTKRKAIKKEITELASILPREYAAVTTTEELASVNAFSTFSLNVSDVAFKLAQSALMKGEWPEAEKMRVEEFVNALDYGDPSPAPGQKVACHTEQCAHPFMQQRNLLRVAMQTSAVGRGGGQPLRLTILLDHSGSMQREDREASVQRAIEVLAGQLHPSDKVSLLGFARTPRLLADRISGSDGDKLIAAVAAAPSEGGTNLEEALKLAAEVAERQFDDGAVNRIILMTDGAANLGNADPEELATRVVELRQKGIAFDACGVGAKGLNDKVLEALTRKGDGRYYFLDAPEQADSGFASQLAGALRPAAKNVKVQVVFNPERVGAYRLIGYEKHRLKKEDFRNDAVDAAEMAAEEAGVALYQFEPKADGSGEVGEVRVRFQDVASGQMIEHTWVLPYEEIVPAMTEAPPSIQLAGTAAMLGEYLRGGPEASNVDLDVLTSLAPSLRSAFGDNVRVNQLIEMIRDAQMAK